MPQQSAPAKAIQILSAFAVLMCLSSASSAAICLAKTDLPAISGTVVTVANATELASAVSNLQDYTTILLKPGNYNLTNTLYIRKRDVSIRGDGTNCEQVALIGGGMDNASYGNVPHGIWSDAANLTITNLTIRDVYQHGIVFNAGAQSPIVNSVRILNTGQQLIKSNPTQYGIGVDNGTVINSYFAYTNGTPTTDHGSGIGYTNGIDIHAGKNWKIAGNRFESFHTPDSSAWWWNPAILVWNGASGTIVENNIFSNVDRAIAFGLMERSGSYDHQGGIIRNNMAYYAPGLFSSTRIADSDAAFIIWNSPGSAVIHNTILTNGNLNKSIEFRFSTTTSGQAISNLADTAIGSRNAAVFNQSNNLTSATSAMFKSPATADLRLLSTATSAINKTSINDLAPTDIDGNARSGMGTVDIGAHEYGAASPPNPPANVQGSQI